MHSKELFFDKHRSNLLGKLNNGNYMIIAAIHKKNVEVRLLLNEHATHQYEMKKHLKTFMYDVKKRRRSADIEAKIYTVSKTQWGVSLYEVTFKPIYIY